jgi:hypothetical protein
MLWHDVPCRLCYSRVCPTTHDCLREVRPRQVVEAVVDLLSGDTFDLAAQQQTAPEPMLSGAHP